jgi:hypothetical protein
LASLSWPAVIDKRRQPGRPAAHRGWQDGGDRRLAPCRPRKRPRSSGIEAKDCGCQGEIHRYRRQSDGNYAHAPGSAMRESPAIVTSRRPRHTGFVYRRTGQPSRPSARKRARRWPAHLVHHRHRGRGHALAGRWPSTSPTGNQVAAHPDGNTRSRRLTPGCVFRIVIT